jgi:hypothetical protein
VPRLNPSRIRKRVVRNSFLVAGGCRDEATEAFVAIVGASVENVHADGECGGSRENEIRMARSRKSPRVATSSIPCFLPASVRPPRWSCEEDPSGDQAHNRGSDDGFFPWGISPAIAVQRSFPIPGAASSI